MEIADQNLDIAGTPELSPLGKRIEMLRIQRGLSKQQLARAVGISRQQLWRVLAGKSELTSSLRERLGFALQADTAVLRPEPAPGHVEKALGAWFAGKPYAAPPQAAPHATATPAAIAATFAQFAADATSVRALLAACPGCEDGAALKRAFLDSIEDIAMARGVSLPAGFFELRRGVIAREL